MSIEWSSVELFNKQGVKLLQAGLHRLNGVFRLERHGSRNAGPCKTAVLKYEPYNAILKRCTQISVLESLLNVFD